MIAEIYSKKLMDKSGSKTSGNKVQSIQDNNLQNVGGFTRNFTIQSNQSKIDSSKPNNHKKKNSNDFRLLSLSNRKYYAVKNDKDYQKQGSIILEEFKNSPQESFRDRGYFKSWQNIEGAEFLDQNAGSMNEIKEEDERFENGQPHQLDSSYKPMQLKSDNLKVANNNSGNRHNSTSSASSGIKQVSARNVKTPDLPALISPTLMFQDRNKIKSSKQLNINMMKVTPSSHVFTHSNTMRDNFDSQNKKIMKKSTLPSIIQ